MKKQLFRKLRPQLDPTGEGYPPALRTLLSLGKPKPGMSYAEWVDRLRDHASQLIQMALDPDLNDRPERDRAVWAPLHALNILAELAPPEAVSPLMKILDWDDDWIDGPMTALLTSVGRDSVPLLKAFAEDGSHTELGRGRAVEGLRAVAEAHADSRDEIVAFLTAFLDRPHADTVDEETLNGWVIGALCDLQATDAVEAIRRAFDESRVNTTIIDLEAVDDLLGLEPAPDEETDGRSLILTLKCRACGRERGYTFAKAYYDLGSISHEADNPNDALIIPERVVCPKCGAVDQYELSGMSHFAVLSKLLAATSGEPDPLPGLVLTDFTTERWGWIPPREALARYASEVAAHPDDAELRIGYGNSLRMLGYEDQAMEQYEQVLMTDPYAGEALINFAQMKSLSGSIPDAIAAWETIQSKFDRLSFAPEDRDMRRQEVEDTIADLRAGVRPNYFRETIPLVEPDVDAPLSDLESSPPMPGPTPRDYQDYHEAAPVRPPLGQYGKVGRNEPCPCGSGKKYKQCHGKK